MIIGIISDTHDNLDALRYWIDYFNQEDVDVLLHAGDVISPFCVSALSSFEGSVYVTFGNNDGDRETLKKKAEDTEVHFKESPVTLDLTECTVAMSHKPSDLPDDVSGSVDLMIHGHTHERREDWSSDVPVVNPGEAGGWITGTSSVALAETADDTIYLDFELVPSP
ncbi:MAG: YfcE family phosphodiesterase [bacterium]